MKIENILSTLNEKQRKAVETIYGPVLVIAGPGSGKTQLLSARIANILATTDYLPSNILCLTFTENAAKNMRERLATMIGQDAYRVAIHTFHSFGNEIINQYRHYTKNYNDAKTIDTIESSAILDDILESLSWDNPYKPGYRASDTIREILSTINNLKSGGVTPALYRDILHANIEAIDQIQPIVESYWNQIDALGQKKEEKMKKIALFEEFTNMVQQLNIMGDFGGFESWTTIIKRSLDEAWQSYENDGSTKFMNSWRDTWTTKNYGGNRGLKETTKREKQEALADIFEQYQKILSEKNLIDFSDMILEAISLIKNYNTISFNLAERYQFIMIDEFQDTNEAQMQLINSILNVGTESPNIFAVGDDDQSIYKFQGANTKNIREYHDRYSDIELIILDINYRSYSEIIGVSRAVIKSELNDISNIFEGAQKKYESKRGKGGMVKKLHFQNELEELSWMIQDITSKVESGIEASSIAVITKKNKTLEFIAKGLLEKGINVHLSKDESIFDSEEIRLLINILRFVDSLDGPYREENAEFLVSILSHPCFDIQRLTLWNISKKIYHARKDTTRSWIESLAKEEDTTIRDIANFFRELARLSHAARLEDIIDYITGANALSLPDEYDEDGNTNTLQIDLFSAERKEYQSPFYNYFFVQLENHNNPKIIYARHLGNMKALIERVRSYKNSRGYLCLNDVIEFMSIIEKYHIDIPASHIIGDESSSVQLITVYKAKGLEWNHVYVPCITRSEYKMGKIGGSPLPRNLPLEAERDEDEDIERLIYTSYTRSRDTLTVSYSSQSIGEKTLEPLACIESESDEWLTLSNIPLENLTSTLAVEKKELFMLPYLGEERDFLRDRIEKLFVMNATALQNFLNVVDAGPEYFVSKTLLRFPQAKNIAASYGSAIHKALEDFFADYMAKKSYQKKILFESFYEYIKKEGFDKKMEDDYIARGNDNLESLYTEITSQSYDELFVEYDFRSAYGGVFLPIEGTQKSIQLTGKIDRIEKKSDDSLIITDYKTGSGFDIFDGKGAEYEKIKQWKYRLQLSFYAILFELSPRWRMYEKKVYELFFVDKDRDENRYHRVMEYIQPGEIDRLKKIIIRVMEKIESLDFPDISKYPKTLEGIRMFEEDLLKGEELS